MSRKRTRNGDLTDTAINGLLSGAARAIVDWLLRCLSSWCS